MTTLIRPTKTRSLNAAFLAALFVLAAQTPASAVEFFAEEETDGSIRVIDDVGVEVPIVEGNPVGTRPSFCPADSYYFNALESDKAQLVLTDCFTGDGAFPVQNLN